MVGGGSPINGGAQLVWGPPYTADELAEAQRRFRLTFPPDLVDLLRTHRLAQGYDWVRDDEAIWRMLAWPFEGILFDVENSGLWLADWGPRPIDADQRAGVVRRAIDAAPKLIPLFSHRYLPEAPNEAGNPVFSVHQSDIIHYGADLADYVVREFIDPRPNRPFPNRPFKTIPFWSGMVAR